MANNLTGWLTIDRLNGEGNSVVTLTASTLATLGERNASLKIKTSSKEAIINLYQQHYEEPLIPDNIPNNQIWAKSTDGTAISPSRYAEDFDYDIVKTELRFDGWTILTFGGDITYIPQQAFQTKENLEEIVIPKSITRIDMGAFAGCYSLASINIPDSVTTIGERAFYECNGLNSITIGAGVSSIAGDAFFPIMGLSSEFNSSLSSIVVSPNNLVYDSRDNCNCLIETATNTLLLGSVNSFIPNTVEIICNYAFSGVPITSIVIPNSVRTIWDYAFHQASTPITHNQGLTTLTIGSNVTYIGKSAFGECPLEEITTYTMTAPTFGEHPFDLISKNGLFLYPSGTEDTNYPWWSSNHGFLGEREWIRGTIPTSGGDKITCTYVTSTSSVTKKICSVDSCAYIKNMTIDGVSVTPIDEYTFDSAGEHTVVFDLYSSSIPDEMFSNLGIMKFTINSGITTIGESAFKNTSLTSVDLGNRVQTIGQGAFSGCESLTEITIPDSVTKIDYIAFRNCENLASVDLGNSVTTINDMAFENCTSLTEITIPNSVTTIGIAAFSYCESLSSITCNGIVAPTIYANAFSSIASNGVLKYPSGSDYSTWLNQLSKYGWTGVPY